MKKHDENMTDKPWKAMKCLRFSCDPSHKRPTEPRGRCPEAARASSFALELLPVEQMSRSVEQNMSKNVESFQHSTLMHCRCTPQRPRDRRHLLLALVLSSMTSMTSVWICDRILQHFGECDVFVMFVWSCVICFAACSAKEQLSNRSFGRLGWLGWLRSFRRFRRLRCRNLFRWVLEEVLEVLRWILQVLQVLLHRVLVNLVTIRVHRQSSQGKVEKSKSPWKVPSLVPVVPVVPVIRVVRVVRFVHLVQLVLVLWLLLLGLLSEPRIIEYSDESNWLTRWQNKKFHDIRWIIKCSNVHAAVCVDSCYFLQGTTCQRSLWVALEAVGPGQYKMQHLWSH